MKRVRILSPMSGLNFSYRVGDEVDLPEDLARALTSEPADEPRAEFLETTSMAAPETATSTPTETTTTSAPEIAGTNRRGRPRKH